MRSNLTRAAEGFEAVKGSDVLLAIELAAPGLAYDRGLKARLYARQGVNELWVIAAERRRRFARTDPRSAGWLTIVETGPEEAAPTRAAPLGFSTRLGSV